MAHQLTLFTVAAAVVVNALLLNPQLGCRIWDFLGYELHGVRPSLQESRSNQEFDVTRFKIESLDGIKPSSVWCSSKNELHKEMYCRIESLCFKANSGELILAFDPKLSTFQPSSLRFASNEPELGRLSSVSGHNLYSVKHFATVLHSRMRFLPGPLYYIPGRTLIMSRFKPDNLMHLLHDDLLPLFATFRQLGLDAARDLVFIDDHWNHSVGVHLFKTLFPISVHKTSFPADSLVCFEHAHIGLLNTTVWYQYGFEQPQSAIERTNEEKLYIRQTIDLFRHQLVIAFKLDNTCELTHSILLVRSLNRRILNDVELFGTIQQHLPDLQLVILDKDFLSDTRKLTELLQILLCAHTLIGMHGSEHILSMLMSPTTHHKVISIIELFPFGIEPSHYAPFKMLAHILTHRYHAWTNDIQTNAIFPGDHYPPEWGGLAHLEATKRQLIEEGIDQTLQPHLCCDNPAWLYRIYQDTIIDLDLFEQFLLLISKEPYNSSEFKPDLYRLSQVGNISCLMTEAKLSISWQPAWNAAGALEPTGSTLKYEVLVQALNTQEASLWESPSSEISMNQTHCSEDGCNIWVRAFAANQSDTNLYEVIGFFNKIPFICTF